MKRRTFLATASAAGATAALNPGLSLAQDASGGFGALTAPWTGPYGGVPPFPAVKVELFKPALEAAIAENLATLDAIAGNPAPPTFENTIAALERADGPLGRVQTLYGVWSGTLATPAMQAVQREMAPRLADRANKEQQNLKLFARVEAVYNARLTSGLTPEQQRLTWVYWNGYVRGGAKLAPAASKRIGEINLALSSLYTRFNENLLADETDYVLYLKTPAETAGLPKSVLDAAAAVDAEVRGRKGEYAILNTRSSVDPFLTYAANRTLREQAWRTFYNRGDNGDAKDNNAIIKDILKLRAERAKLLGFATHAHWRLENAMAKTPDAAMALMMSVWPAAIGRVHEEVAEMQAIADKEGAGLKIAPWDYRFYAEKVRSARYDLDMNTVKPYLQLDKLREGMFWAAGQLYGFQFVLAELPVAHPDIRVWEVKAADGAHVGLWYFDPYARIGKRSGAWMNAYRRQSKFDRPVTTIVSNNSNFVKGAPGEPVLISWDDATTMFHEFGHALHGLNSNVSYPSVSGTAVARDYVEFPSQVNESWLPTREVLSRFAVHYQTGAAMPQALADKIAAAATFRQGFEVTEYLASALIDMKLHLAGDADIDPDAFEKTELAKLGMPAELPMRHRTPQFQHIFASDSYSAGYYSYLWSEVIALDAFGAFEEAGGPYDKAVAKRFHDKILSVGNSIDPAVAYRAFRGRDPKPDAYFKDKGFKPA